MRGVEDGEGGECGIEHDEIEIAAGGDQGVVVKGNLEEITATLEVMATGVVYEDAPHQLGGNGKEMSSILPLHLANIDEAYVGLVDEGSGLQAVTVALAFHVPAGEAAKFAVDDRGDLNQSRGVAGGPGLEQGAYVTGPRSHRIRISRALDARTGNDPGSPRFAPTPGGGV